MAAPEAATDPARLSSRQGSAGHAVAGSQQFNIHTDRHEYKMLQFGLRGEHQIVNAAAAIAAVEALVKCGIDISEDAIREGIAKVRWPGRMEVLRKTPLLILDGAQNEASARAMISALKRHFGERKIKFVLGVSSDKDIEGICNSLSRSANNFILTRADNPRAADPNHLKSYIKDKPVEILPNSSDAVNSALKNTKDDEMVVVTGSLYLVGEVRGRFKSDG